MTSKLKGKPKQKKEKKVIAKIKRCNFYAIN